MPQSFAPNQPVATQGDFSNYLLTKINALEGRFNAIYPHSGTTFTPGGDINMAGNDILAGGDITCNTLNYTTLNPPIGVGVFLPLAGGVMTGNIDMGTSEIVNVSRIQNSGTSIRIGTNARSDGPNNVVIGPFTNSLDVGSERNVILGYGAQGGFASRQIVIGAEAQGGQPDSIVIGRLAGGGVGIGPSTNPNQILIGNNVQSDAGQGSVAIGTNAHGQPDSVVIGRNSTAGVANTIVIGATSSASAKAVVVGDTCVSSATGADVFGTSLTNATANSLILGNTSYVNIRPASVTCDLGTTALPFVNGYFGNIVASAPSAISILSTTVTATNYVAAGSALVSLTGFTQLQNPHSDFTFVATTGQITYTGAPTRRFRVVVNFSHVGMAGAPTVYHFISRNGSTALTGERTKEVPGSDTTAYVSFCLSAIVQMATGNTVQLAVNNSAGTPAVNYDAVSYTITQV